MVAASILLSQHIVDRVDINPAFDYHQKQLAARLGTAPVAVMNLIRKYVEGKPVGRASKKVNQESQPEQVQVLRREPEPQLQEKPKQKIQQEQPQEVKPKRKYNKRVKLGVVIELPKAAMEADIKPESVKSEVINVSASNIDTDSFSIIVKKTISGEDAQVMLNGIVSMLIKDQQYSIEVKITEK